MFKKLILAIFYFFILYFISSEDNFFYNRKFTINYFSYIEINNGNIKYYEDGPNGYKIFFEGKYSLLKKDGFNLLNVNNKTFVIYYLIDSIILCDIKTKENIIGSDSEGKGASPEPNLFPLTIIDSSSYLTEGKINYSPHNLEDYDLTTPWIEGEKGDGIGSKLIVESEMFYPTEIIIIANGFFNPQKLYLYYYNNRVKKIKIKSLDIDNSFEIFVDLKDTYNLQMVRLPKKSTKFEMTILDVYKGTKFKDTCIAGLFISRWSKDKTMNFELNYTVVN